MIEQALCEHLKSKPILTRHLAIYADEPAIFNQEAPADTDMAWEAGPQYGRLVFAVTMQGDPERAMGGTLVVDIMCQESECVPEDIEPILKSLIHGYFFSNEGGELTVAAQWKSSDPFTQPADDVIGCTVTFDLLGFPVLTTSTPDVIDRLNEWSVEFDGVHVINHDPLPDPAWKPCRGQSAVYWRLLSDNPAGWIPDTFQTIWRTATVKGHIFAEDNAAAVTLARHMTTRLYACKRLFRGGEAPIMVNRKNTVDAGADPLRTGQMTVEATYGIVVYFSPSGTIEHIDY